MNIHMPSDVLRLGREHREGSGSRSENGYGENRREHKEAKNNVPENRNQDNGFLMAVPGYVVGIAVRNGASRMSASVGAVGASAGEVFPANTSTIVDVSEASAITVLKDAFGRAVDNARDRLGFSSGGGSDLAVNLAVPNPTNNTGYVQGEELAPSQYDNYNSYVEANENNVTYTTTSVGTATLNMHFAKNNTQGNTRNSEKSREEINIEMAMKEMAKKYADQYFGNRVISGAEAWNINVAINEALQACSSLNKLDSNYLIKFDEELQKSFSNVYSKIELFDRLLTDKTKYKIFEINEGEVDSSEIIDDQDENLKNLIIESYFAEKKGDETTENEVRNLLKFYKYLIRKGVVDPNIDATLQKNLTPPQKNIISAIQDMFTNVIIGETINRATIEYRRWRRRMARNEHPDRLYEKYANEKKDSRLVECTSGSLGSLSPKNIILGNQSIRDCVFNNTNTDSYQWEAFDENNVDIDTYFKELKENNEYFQKKFGDFFHLLNESGHFNPPGEEGYKDKNGNPIETPPIQDIEKDIHNFIISVARREHKHKQFDAIMDDKNANRDEISTRIAAISSCIQAVSAYFDGFQPDRTGENLANEFEIEDVNEDISYEPADPTDFSAGGQLTMKGRINGHYVKLLYNTATGEIFFDNFLAKYDEGHIVFGENSGITDKIISGLPTMSNLVSIASNTNSFIADNIIENKNSPLYWSSLLSAKTEHARLRGFACNGSLQTNIDIIQEVNQKNLLKQEILKSIYGQFYSNLDFMEDCCIESLGTPQGEMLNLILNSINHYENISDLILFRDEIEKLMEHLSNQSTVNGDLFLKKLFSNSDSGGTDMVDASKENMKVTTLSSGQGTAPTREPDKEYNVDNHDSDTILPPSLSSGNIGINIFFNMMAKNGGTLSQLTRDLEKASSVRYIDINVLGEINTTIANGDKTILTYISENKDKQDNTFVNNYKESEYKDWLVENQEARTVAYMQEYQQVAESTDGELASLMGDVLGNDNMG